MKTSHLLVAALFASVAGAGMAQTTPPQGGGATTPTPNVTPRMPAGQQSSQNTPMGETGTQRPAAGAPAAAPMASPAPAPMPMAAAPAPAPRMRADRN